MKTPKLAEGWRMMCLNCYLGEEFNYVEGKIKRRNTSSTVSSRTRLLSYCGKPNYREGQYRPFHSVYTLDLFHMSFSKGIKPA